MGNKGPYNVNVKWENDEAEYDYDDEEDGGLRIEGGYNKGPYNVNVKWENDEAEYDYDDEEVGGLSIEGGYNKGPYNVNVKCENDELGEETRSPSSAKFGDKLRERVKSRLFIKWARTHLKKEKAL